VDARTPSGVPIRQTVVYPHGRVAYVAAVVVLVISAVIGLIGIQRDATNGAAAGGISDRPQSSSPLTGTDSTGPATQQAAAIDHRGDTTGPDLLRLSAVASRGMLRVRIELAAPITDDAVLRVFIDADSDRTTGSLSFPCSAATLGADYEVVAHQGHSERFMTSTANGCETPFRATRSPRLTMRVADDRVNLGIPTSAVRRPGQHVIALAAQAVSTTGGQIDSCPGQHDRPLSVQY
jgi:hypothetical protein